MYRVGQNHIYTVYVRYFGQENHQLYGQMRCIYTVPANPSCVPCEVGRVPCEVCCVPCDLCVLCEVCCVPREVCVLCEVGCNLLMQCHLFLTGVGTYIKV